MYSSKKWAGKGKWMSDGGIWFEISFSFTANPISLLVIVIYDLRQKCPLNCVHDSLGKAYDLNYASPSTLAVNSIS